MTSDTSLFEAINCFLSQDRSRVAKAARIASAIRNACGYRWVGIYEVDAFAGLVKNVAWSGPSAPAHPIFPVTQGLTSRVILQKQSVNVGDVGRDADYLTALSGTQAEIILPVFDSGHERVIGTLDVESEKRNAFDSAAQALLEECAARLPRLFS